MSNGAPGTRSCTADFKIKVTGRWCRNHGAHGGRRCPQHRADDHTTGGCLPGPREPGRSCRHPEAAHDCNRGPRPDCGRCRPPNPATVAIGISLDEIHRANTRRVEPHERITYPLLDARLRRSDCLRIIAEAGLPIPGKSSCFFCPLHTPAAWADQARDEPALFARSCQLEELLNARRGELGKDPVFLTRFATPLAEAVGTGQDLLPFDDGGCDSGWCMT